MSNNGDEPERVCELECRGLQGIPARREFVGPVKITLIESTPVDYRRKVCVSAMIAMAILLLGVPVFTLYLYTMQFRLPLWVNLHIVLCTMAVQMFMVPGILVLCSSFGGGMYLSLYGRRFQHLLLQSFAVGCGVVGALLMLPYLHCSGHDVLGFFGVLFSVFASVLGPGAYFTAPTRFFGRVSRKVHMIFSVPSYICSSLCFATIYSEPKFVDWLGTKSYVLILTAINTYIFLTVLVAIFIKVKTMGDDTKSDIVEIPKNRLATLNLFNVMIASEHRDSYCLAVWMAAAVGLSHILIGAVNITLIMYSYRRTESHSAYFTIAYNFFAAEAILSLSFVNGWATPIRSMHRKYVHIFLQLCTIITAVSGMIIVARKLQFQRTAHSVLGMLTLLLTLLSSLTGPFALKLVVRKGHFVHMSCGILCFCSSMICLCTGLVKQDLKRWTGQNVVYMLNLFIIFYSSLIVITTIIKVVNKG
ncbi:uncharacterized protein LOC111356822 [Spodoptera litura]|uniref:ascorbate ferrireductase (transmembrane) n=1 Tax=Spodoptera litura TaxID=69820 RepID=A0A9J7EEE5_SPOLT|nr:uncharacterized protein LOC111356822 [Spodoptera litura]